MNTQTQEIKTLTGHTQNLEQIAWSHDGQRLASSAACDIIVWNIKSGLAIETFGKDCHSLEVSCLAFSPDGKYLASADWDGQIILRDTNTFYMVNRLRYEKNTWITGICWSPDSSTLAIIDFYIHNHLVLWNVIENTTINMQCNSQLYRPTRMTSITYTKDGQYILTGTEDYPNKLIWNQNNTSVDKQNMLVKVDHYKRELDGTYDSFSVYNISACYDSKVFASRGGSGITKLWDIESRELIQELTDVNNPIRSIEWSPIADMFAIGCENGDIKIYSKMLG